MDNRFIAGASAFLVVGGIAGCSSPAPEPSPRGTLPAGTAEVSINGTGTGTTHSVSCSTIGPVTTIKTGGDDAGTTASINTAHGLAVQFARINNLDGFTGSYWAELGPTAEVQMTGQTYLMTGSATGFDTDNPSFRATRTFSIKAAC